MSFIENEAAYEAAIARRIRANAHTGWINRDPSRLDLMAAIQAEVDRRPGGFMSKMLDAITVWGKLSDGQEAAARKIIADNGAKRTQWAAEARARDAVSTHQGVVGTRQIFGGLTIRFVTSFEGTFGTTFVTGLADEQGNVFVYKGSGTVGDKGEVVSLKATVKAHGERDGIKQTMISRPAII